MTQTTKIPRAPVLRAQISRVVRKYGQVLLWERDPAKRTSAAERLRLAGSGIVPAVAGCLAPGQPQNLRLRALAVLAVLGPIAWDDVIGRLITATGDKDGDRCMITGCALMDVVEAAHIKPYRGDDDNHPANGLLLRADLHTLFDLDLIGVEPGTLIVRVHDDAKRAGYEAVGGLMLRCGGARPSAEALAIRWRSFSGKQAGNEQTEEMGAGGRRVPPNVESLT